MCFRDRKMKGKSKSEVKNTKALMANDTIQKKLVTDTQNTPQYIQKGFLFTFDYLWNVSK